MGAVQHPARAQACYASYSSCGYYTTEYQSSVDSDGSYCVYPFFLAWLLALAQAITPLIVLVTLNHITMSKYYEALGEVASPLIDETNDLMTALNEAGIRPTQDMSERMARFSSALFRAKLFVMLDIDDDAEYEVVKNLITETGTDLKLGLEVQHAIHLRKN